MKNIFITVCVIVSMLCGAAQACEINKIDVLGDGSKCETAKFTITTTYMEANTKFKFYMSAMGTFYVDWGDGNIDTITRTDTTETLYDHTYTTAGVKTIRFGGLATGYDNAASANGLDDDSAFVSTIRFGYTGTTPTLVAAIDGSIGQIFPTLGQSSGQQPRFKQTFYSTKITSIPENLFSGIFGGTAYLFNHTFHSCTSLESIPENLFININRCAHRMFRGTFGNCYSLTEIPADLFSEIHCSATDMFLQTFSYCTSLKSIPSGLFNGISNIAPTDSWIFYGTFMGCSRLTKLPDTLFSNITTISGFAFRSTFYGCTGLTGYIPPTLFSGLIANGSPTATDMWAGTFSYTNLATTCPAGTVQFITGYEDYWDGHVSCVDENLVCGAGEYLPQHWYQCEKCPNNNYCSGGIYTYNGNSQGATACPSGLYSPTGMWESAQCGRILHIGDNVVYLRSVKKTTPALHVDIDNDGVADFFGNVTTLDVPMHTGTDRKLKLQYNGVTYSVYDDTVDVGE